MPTTRIADLIQIASALTKITPADIIGRRRCQRYVRVRQAICYVARKQGVHSYPQIGKMLGGRDHSTIIHNARKAEIIAERDPAYRELLLDLEAEANAADPWVKVWWKRNEPVTVAVKLEIATPKPKARRPMFAEPPEPNDSAVKHNAMVRRGSANLLAALLAA